MNSKSDFFKKFTNQFQLSKTLRFELIPQGNTLENIEALIEKDKQRATSYQEMKKTIDEYHKWFIEMAFKGFQLDGLTDYAELYFVNKEVRDEVAFNEIKTNLRKEVVNNFSEGSAKDIFKNLFVKELIKNDLESWIKENNPDLYFDESFKNFTTYFTGFHENRKNLYSSEEQSTAIAYRIIHENLPKHLDNVKNFNSIQTNEIKIDFSSILKEMEDLIQGRSLEEIFSINYFNNLLGQTGIDFINFIIGGRTLENGTKIKGLNEYINLFNQRQTEKSKRLPKFKQLYKQILSDRSSISFLGEAFKNDKELLGAINTFYRDQLICFRNKEDSSNSQTINVLTSVKKLMDELSFFDIKRLENIYLRRDIGFTSISQKLFGSYSVFTQAISFYYDNEIDKKFQEKITKNGISEDGRKKIQGIKDKWRKDYISIELLQNCIDLFIGSLGSENELQKFYSKNMICHYFKTHFIHVSNEINNKTYDFVSHINAQYKGIEGLLNIENDDRHVLIQDKERVHQLKIFLDSILELLHFVKPLYCKDESITEKDELFYEEFNSLYAQLSFLTPIYNMVRNYVTQKPYQTEKIKLNFENSQLLNGWDKNKEKDNTSILLRKNGDYYLAIMSKKHNKLFENAPREKTIVNSFEKINYKLLPGANKMLPKVFFGASNIEFYSPSDEILRIRNTSSHSKNGVPQKGFKKGDFNLSDCHTLIDFFKKSLSKHEDWKSFGFDFSPTKSYEDISGFYREVENQGYKISFDNIPEKYINQMVQENKLFLFKLYNKDFSKYSKGSPNMHTIYWKALFDEQNLSNVVYKLNGQAEIFFRKASILSKNIITHKKGIAIDSKNPLKMGQNIFAYDLIKDRRYTVDKFQFHVPITMNFKANGTDRINVDVNNHLKNNPDVNIIGLDRGERHLIYLTLINQKGEILKQESLNIIKSENHLIETTYHTLLDVKEKERAEAREEWGAIESIKELKEGYISQVVHKITTMMIEHNAIVVMEDLNFGFKRGRFHVEKQVYQKLEKMLIDKLNYLVFKNKDKMEVGGVLNALQLTSKFESFQKMGKQTGFMYYVPAWNTSKIDPVTGFVDFLKPKYESVNASQIFISKFKSITFNKNKEHFEFAFDYNDFTTRAEGSKCDWVLCANNQNRYNFNKSLNQNKGAQELVKVCEQLELLFTEYGIIYREGTAIQTQIANQTNSEFFKKLLKLMAISLALRHNNGKKGSDEQDFILSPMANEKGEFFSTLNAIEKLPKDADANGAYHIALKGLWVLNKLKITEDLAKPKLAISNKEWLRFVQDKEYLN